MPEDGDARRRRRCGVGETEEERDCYDVESIQVREQARGRRGKLPGEWMVNQSGPWGRERRRIIDSCMEKRTDRYLTVCLVRQADRAIKTD